MRKKFTKAIAASLVAAAMLTSTTAAYAPFSASAELLAETTFDSKMLPWQTVESAPAEQYFALEDGAVHITINESEGANGERWDLQFRYRNLSFQKGHTYKIRFDAKSNRNGLELHSRLGTIKGDEEYVVLNKDGFDLGYHMGGDFGTGTTLTTEYQTFEGEFTCTSDLEAVEWSFHYAKGTEWGGNAEDGDEIWFDNMSIICTSCDELYNCNKYANPDFLTPTTTTTTTTTTKSKTTTTTKPKTTTTKPKSTTTKPKTTTTTTTTTAPPVTKNEFQLLGETSFDYKGLPWHTVTQSPAKQNFAIEDGAYHISIINAEGADHERWDLAFRYRNLSFKAGHTYEVSFKVKSNRAGMELCSSFTDRTGEEQYFVLNGDEMEIGPYFDGRWGKAAELTTKYKTYSGTFTPTKDLEGVDWRFEYADGTDWEGNAQDGDELWFDDMSIICTTCDEENNICGCKEDPRLLYTDRDNAAMLNPDQLMVDGEMVNYISVNQLGYMPNLAKVATFSDNAGSVTPNSSTIKLTEDTYEFELVDVSTGKVVYEGVSGKKFKDYDSSDNVCKLDFSEYNTTGEYYLRIKGTNWRSFNFKIADNIYSGADNNMLTNALNLYYHNRSGIDILPEYITSGEQSELAHRGLNKADRGYVQKKWVNGYNSSEEASETYGSSTIDINGGWYNPSDYGKSVVGGGMTAWTLMNMYERTITVGKDKGKFDDNTDICVVPETGNEIPDILDEVAYELDWMAKMKVQPDEPTWGEYAGLYYHMVQDSVEQPLYPQPNYECEPAARVVKPPTFAATLSYAACAAQAARLWADYDAEKAENYLKSAIEAYEAYMTHWYAYDDTVVRHPEYGMECAAEELNEKSLYAPMLQAKGGEPYGDDEVRDDAYWAACEIFVSASRMGESETAKEYKAILSESDYALKVFSRLVSGESKDGEFTSLRWDQTSCAGSLSLVLHEDLLSDEEAEIVMESVLEAADDYVAMEEKQAYGLPYIYDGAGYNDPNSLPPQIIINGYKYGSNGMAVTNAIVMAYAYDITNDIEYINGVLQTMDYMLGNNPLSFSYITGYGSYGVQTPHHKYWMNEISQTLPMAPNGILVSGPSAEITDYYMRGLGFEPGYRDNISQRCYADSWEAWSVNDVSLEWNASLAWVVSFLQDETTLVGSDPVEEIVCGDANCDGVVSMADAASIFQSLGNPDKYALSANGMKNADVIDNGKGITAADAIAVQAVMANVIDAKSLPMTQDEYSKAMNK